MVKMLSLTPGEMTNGVLTEVAFTEEHLDRAKNALLSIDAFGLHEQFEDFCTVLCHKFGFRLGEPVFANLTPSQDAPSALREQIAEDNCLDVELYHFARSVARSRSEIAASLRSS
jgi:hypothetical protein